MSLTSLEDIVKAQAKKCNNAHFMLVDGMSKVMTQKVQRCESLKFSAFGLKWKLELRSDLSKDYLALFLTITDEQCTGSNWEINCSFKLSVVSHTGPSSDICKLFQLSYNSKAVSWGTSSLISHEVLKEKFLVNDKAVFSAEITKVEPKFLNVTSISQTMGTAERLKLMEVPRKNSRFTWKITQFSSFNGTTHSSYEFTVGQRRWRLDMYPKGAINGQGHLSLYLTATDYVNNAQKGPTLALFKLRVLDQLKRNHKETEHQAWFLPDINNSWGVDKYMPLTELHKASNGFLVNDEIYLGVEFLIVSTTEYL